LISQPSTISCSNLIEWEDTSDLVCNENKIFLNSATSIGIALYLDSEAIDGNNPKFPIHASATTQVLFRITLVFLTALMALMEPCTL